MYLHKKRKKAADLTHLSQPQPSMVGSGSRSQRENLVLHKNLLPHWPGTLGYYTELEF